MSRSRSRLAVTAATAVLSLLTAGVVGAASPASAGSPRTTFIDYGSDQWTYRQVPHGRLPAFQDGSYEDNNFREGEAGFGTVDGTCPNNDPRKVKTRWKPGTDLLLRQTFYLPDEEDPVEAGDLRLVGTVDESADVYLNGRLVAHVDAQPCQRRAIHLDLGDGDHGFNYLAVRASDTGGATYVDVKLTGVIYDGF